MILLLSILDPQLLCSGEDVVATGCFTCRDDSGEHAVIGANVFMRDNDVGGRDDSMGQSVTDHKGCFEVSGSGDDVIGGPDVFVELQYESSNYGLKVSKISLIPVPELEVQKDRTNVQVDASGQISFHTTTFSSDACQSYVYFVKALQDFRTFSDLEVPFSKLDVITDVGYDGVYELLRGSIPSLLGISGTSFESYIPSMPDLQPLTIYDKIVVQNGSKMSFGKARHELGHAIRHTYDGDALHFASDVIIYSYGRTHTCSTDLNEGFAFNEGVAIWNEYWDQNSSCGNASASKSVEGNVAKALFEIRKSGICDLTYAKIWQALRDNPGKIHSFSDFCKYACASSNDCVNVGISTTPPPTLAPPVTDPPATTTTSEVCSSQPTLRLYSGYSSYGQEHLQGAVEMLQNMLNMYNGAGLSVDGYFGALTDNAVRAYQASRGLVDDGIVGPITWGALCGEVI